jgi:hypothetical protein
LNELDHVHELFVDNVGEVFRRNEEREWRGRVENKGERGQKREGVKKNKNTVI